MAEQKKITHPRRLTYNEFRMKEHKYNKDYEELKKRDKKRQHNENEEDKFEFDQIVMSPLPDSIYRNVAAEGESQKSGFLAVKYRDGKPKGFEIIYGDEHNNQLGYETVYSNRAGHIDTPTLVFSMAPNIPFESALFEPGEEGVIDSSWVAGINAVGGVSNRELALLNLWAAEIVDVDSRFISSGEGKGKMRKFFEEVADSYKELAESDLYKDKEFESPEERFNEMSAQPSFRNHITHEFVKVKIAANNYMINEFEREIKKLEDEGKEADPSIEYYKLKIDQFRINNEFMSVYKKWDVEATPTLDDEDAASWSAIYGFAKENYTQAIIMFDKECEAFARFSNGYNENDADATAEMLSRAQRLNYLANFIKLHPENPLNSIEMNRNEFSNRRNSYIADVLIYDKLKKLDPDFNLNDIKTRKANEAAIIRAQKELDDLHIDELVSIMSSAHISDIEAHEGFQKLINDNGEIDSSAYKEILGSLGEPEMSDDIKNRIEAAAKASLKLRLLKENLQENSYALSVDDIKYIEHSQKICALKDYFLDHREEINKDLNGILNGSINASTKKLVGEYLAAKCHVNEQEFLDFFNGQDFIWMLQGKEYIPTKSHLSVLENPDIVLLSYEKSVSLLGVLKEQAAKHPDNVEVRNDYEFMKRFVNEKKIDKERTHLTEPNFAYKQYKILTYDEIAMTKIMRSPLLSDEFKRNPSNITLAKQELEALKSNRTKEALDLKAIIDNAIQNPQYVYTKVSNKDIVDHYKLMITRNMVVDELSKMQNISKINIEEFANKEIFKPKYRDNIIMLLNTEEFRDAINANDPSKLKKSLLPELVPMSKVTDIPTLKQAAAKIRQECSQDKEDYRLEHSQNKEDYEKIMQFVCSAEIDNDPKKMQQESAKLICDRAIVDYDWAKAVEENNGVAQKNAAIQGALEVRVVKGPDGTEYGKIVISKKKLETIPDIVSPGTDKDEVVVSIVTEAREGYIKGKERTIGASFKDVEKQLTTLSGKYPEMFSGGVSDMMSYIEKDKGNIDETIHFLDSKLKDNPCYGFDDNYKKREKEILDYKKQLEELNTKRAKEEATLQEKKEELASVRFPIFHQRKTRDLKESIEKTEQNISDIDKAISLLKEPKELTLQEYASSKKATATDIEEFESSKKAMEALDVLKFKVSNLSSSEYYLVVLETRGMDSLFEGDKKYRAGIGNSNLKRMHNTLTEKGANVKHIIECAEKDARGFGPPEFSDEEKKQITEYLALVDSYNEAISKIREDLPTIAAQNASYESAANEFTHTIEKVYDVDMSFKPGCVPQYIRLEKIVVDSEIEKYRGSISIKAEMDADRGADINNEEKDGVPQNDLSGGVDLEDLEPSPANSNNSPFDGEDDSAVLE